MSVCVRVDCSGGQCDGDNWSPPWTVGAHAEVSHCCLLTASLQCVNTLLGLCPSPLCVTAVGCTMQSLSVNEVSFSPFDARTGRERYTLNHIAGGGGKNVLRMDSLSPSPEAHLS
jgi:hypothetical protein